MSRDSFILCDNPECSTTTPLGEDDAMPPNWWTGCFAPSDYEGDDMPNFECCTQRCLSVAVGSFDWPNHVGS